MTDDSNEERLRQLRERIAKVRQGQDSPSETEDHHSQAHIAWRMVTELVAGLLIGFGIGYGLDVIFGTLPILLVLFTLLGFAAGVRVMLRTAQEIPAQREAEAARRAAERKKGDGRRG